ncbi:MAG TPA: transaldolase [Dinghuibacter sp.]|jgi:transaldolase/transaldolase/glucose-6-phosphate isomerase|uniref:transaldolase n=1 Tax=Dinghuibacter sp. TaxID=2024697 RepID=UPI002BF7F84C|nr:transaldolase [Dinghuibacter sp.]HTJ14254.1 transaldolase [Dinghuibacter sp.]
MTTTIRQTHELGQSIWLDSIDRNILRNGVLRDLIIKEGVSGLTSNPTIFEKSMSSGDLYDADIRRLSEAGVSTETAFFDMAIQDIQDAAGLLRPVYDEERGNDGFVSLEVSPRLARNTAGTLAQALSLWSRVDRPNVMIKIPGTAEGIPAIRAAIREGVNINITLLFSLERYRSVVDAYMLGLEDRLATGKPVHHIHSVASFFLSRIDTLIDPILEAQGHKEWVGEVALACAREAYQIYKELFFSQRWARLRDQGAHPQRLLWASTGSKNPAYGDLKYVDALIGPDTVDTMPMETIKAFLDHGHPGLTLENGVEDAQRVLNGLRESNIDLEALAGRLEEEGIKKFNEPFDKLLSAIGRKMGVGG